jgi:hypothetical protein
MDDIDYALQHCDSDTYILNVDSASRDRRMYPHPSEYSIQFSETFRLVHGLEILDASIPNTMYTIDTHNNTLAIIKIEPNIWKPVDHFAILRELQSVPQFVHTLDNNTPGIFVVDADADSQVPEGSDVTLLRRCAVSDVQLEELSDAAAKLSPDLVFTYDRASFRVVADGTYAPGASPLDLTSALRAGTIFMYPQQPVGRFLIVYYRIFNTTTAFATTLINAALYEVKLTNILMHFPVGNYDVRSFQSQAITEFRTWGLDIDVRPVSVGNVTQRNQFVYSCGASSAFVFNMKNSGLRTIMGFDEYSQAATNDYVPVSFANNYQLFGSKPAADAAFPDRSSITCPGIMDFSGTRYITLHCVELEDVMYSSLPYGTVSTGIGVFKLGSSSNNDVTFLRFDFTKFYRKPFHPIGRLTRLTFRFSLPDGSLYDFKGVNHNMMLLIKYYAPKSRIFRAPSNLNPNYNPDVLQYLMRDSDDNDDPHQPQPPLHHLVDAVRQRERLYQRLVDQSEIDSDN